MSLNRLLLLFCFLGSTAVWAQPVAKTIVLEHYTNSRCSICANRNPALFQNLANHPQVLHLSIHPSSPYANCFLSQRNASTNDARTNYYGIYGGTPRLVINGVVQTPGVNFGAASIFAPFEQDSTAFMVTPEIALLGSDSILYTIKIVRKAADMLDSAVLFSGILQDTVFGNGGNGEQAHYQVLVAGAQQTISLPPNIGDSVVISSRLALRANWVPARLMSLGLLQQTSSKVLIQAAKSDLLVTGVSSSTRPLPSNEAVQLYPNPSTGWLKTNLEPPFGYRLQSSHGGLLQSGLSTNGEIQLEADLVNGLYLLQLTTAEGFVFIQKVILAR